MRKVDHPVLYLENNEFLVLQPMTIRVENQQCLCVNLVTNPKFHASTVTGYSLPHFSNSSSNKNSSK